MANKKETTALVPAGTPAGTAVVRLPDVGTLLDIFHDNFEDGDIDAFQLPRLKVPSGGGLAWTVPTEDGPKPEAVVSGVIIHHRTWRTYWAGKFEDSAGGTPPDCSSKDGKIGSGLPGGSCLVCPLNEWGSADVADDTKKGKACKESRAVFFLQDGDMLPTLLLLPPMSIKPFKDYLMLITTKMQKPFWQVKTKFALAQDKNAANITYSRATPMYDGALAPDDVLSVRLLKETIVPMLDSYVVSVERSDVEGPEA